MGFAADFFGSRDFLSFRHGGGGAFAASGFALRVSQEPDGY
jgi:hypothetical protein